MPLFSIPHSKYFLFSISILFFLNGCNQNQKEQKTENKTVANNSITTPATGCYQLVIKDDTATMNVRFNGDSVSGNLIYKRKDKDSNSGTFDGNFVNDTMDILYHYQSEGIMSFRQIKMLYFKNSFAEGYGDIIQKGDTALFKFPNALKFELNHLYTPINCP